MPLCSDFYGDSGDMRTILWHHYEKYNLKFFAAEFLEFSLKFFLDYWKVSYLNQFLNEYFCSPIVGLLLKSLKHYKWLFSYSTNIRTTKSENKFLTKVAITPTVHNIFSFFSFSVYTYLLTLFLLINYRQFCQNRFLWWS